MMKAILSLNVKRQMSNVKRQASNFQLPTSNFQTVLAVLLISLGVLVFSQALSVEGSPAPTLPPPQVGAGVRCCIGPG